VAALFPLFLKLANRRCLVVGAGQIGRGKIAGLLAAGAKVRVVAPEAEAQVARWARAGRLRWARRRFRASDLTGCFCVVAATPSGPLHRTIHRLARRRGVLCNVVDVPELCDFYYPAVVRRGALQIAISTAGRSPALAQRLRKRLEREFGPEYAAWVAALGRSRRQAGSEDAKERQASRHALASEKAFRAFLSKQGARKKRR